MLMTFIRHGKTAGNLQHRYVGRTDEPLSTVGIEQIKARRDFYKAEQNADVVFVSPMQRCRQTAGLLFGAAAPIVIVDDFREYDFGEFEGKNHEELMELESYRRWLESNGAYDLPAGEGMDNFRRRVIGAFNSTFDICCRKSYQNAVYVVHGGTIMTIFERYDSEEKNYYDYMCKNAQGYRAKFDGKVLERVDK